MVKVYDGECQLRLVRNDRDLYEGQLVLYRSVELNGTGCTESYCYVDEVLDRDKKLYRVKEIKAPKSFEKSITNPTPREFVLEDLNYEAITEQVGKHLATFEYLTETSTYDVSVVYGKPWKQILEQDRDLKTKKMWRK